MAVTVSDVEMNSSNGWSHLDTARKEHLLDRAESEVTDLYSGRVANLSQIKGQKDHLVELVAAHRWELASGGESNSESGGGGQVNYNTVTGEVNVSWSETRYGRQALEYLRDEQNIAIVRTR